MNELFNTREISENVEKINLDELYEKKKNQDLAKLAIYNKVLNRIHDKIKITSRQRKDEQYCWYVVPEIMIGVANYDHSSCISYILTQLQENGFNVRYTHPNLIFISWMHYVPSYVRTEFKKKTGIVIDQYGNKVGGDEDDDLSNPYASSNKNNNDNSIESLTMSLGKKLNIKNQQNEQKKDYKPINTYKPTGSLVYNNDLFKKIEDKFT